MTTPKIVCAVSGVTLNEEDEGILEALDIKDGASELPVGWTRVRLESRVLNPSFEAIQFVKAGLVAQVLSQLPSEMREDSEEAISIQYDAQFAALEAQEANIPTLLIKVDAYIAPVDRVPGLEKEVEKLFSTLGVDFDDDDEDDDDEPESEEGEDDGENSDQTENEKATVAPSTARRRRRRRTPSDETQVEA